MFITIIKFCPFVSSSLFIFLGNFTIAKKNLPKFYRIFNCSTNLKTAAITDIFINHTNLNYCHYLYFYRYVLVFKSH